MTKRALLLLLASNVLGGSSYLATAWALKGTTPLGLTFWRLALASLCFLPYAVRGLRRSWPSPRDWLGLLGVALLGLAAPLIVGSYGLRLSSATNGSLLIGMEPLSVVVLSAVFLGERFSLIKGAAVALGIGGSALIVLQSAPWAAALTPHWRGDLILAFHGFLWALYTVIGKPVLKRVDAMTYCALTTLLALPFVSAAAAVEGIRLPTAAYGSLLYLAVGVTVFGVITWNEALEETQASVLANFVFLQPVIGVALGVLLQGDAFTRWSAFGGAAIVGGVWLAARSPSVGDRDDELLAPSRSTTPDTLNDTGGGPFGAGT